MKKFGDFDEDFEDFQGDEGEGGEGGEGKSGEVGGPRIHIETSRDDLLSPSEINRLLEVHREYHKGYVDKQKLTREDRAALKEGRKTLRQQQQMGMGLGRGQGSSPFKKHPISDRAQFSGIDRQVSFDPRNFDADTNAEKQNENELKYNLNFQPKRQFNPKPSPF